MLILVILTTLARRFASTGLGGHRGVESRSLDLRWGSTDETLERCVAFRAAVEKGCLAATAEVLGGSLQQELVQYHPGFRQRGCGGRSGCVLQRI